MLPRYASNHAKAILTDTPVLGIIGPRQAGKTTLAKSIGGGRDYFNLDMPGLRAAAIEDPVGFLRDRDGAIIDEIQRAPDLMLAVKAAVDADRRPGRFIVTGSANLLTLRTIQDSLAGRIELLPLMPLSQDELAANGPAHFLDRLFAGDSFLHARRDPHLIARVLTGGFPDAIARTSAIRRNDWFAAYVRAIAERDIPDIANIERPATLPRLLQLVAALNGQLINGNELGSRLGIDRKTALRYLDLIEQTFVVRTLPAWTSNAVSRLIKGPKLHFVDTGLAAHLANITEQKLMSEKGPFGMLLESFVLAELDKQCRWSIGRYTFSHFRDKDGAEVDIVVEDQAGRVAGIEIKASATVGRKDFTGLARLRSAAGNRFANGVVLYDGEDSLAFGDSRRAVPISTLWSPNSKQD
jgi:hypothetical protein